MSNTSKNFTAEEKAAIALKAVSGGEGTLQKLADEHNISEEEIRGWIRESGVSSVDQTEEEISVEASDDFIKSVEHGVTFDVLNYRRLTFWSIFGTSVLVLFVIAIMYMYEYTRTASIQLRSEQSLFYNIEELRQNDREKLESFGVVDPEEGIYRIPIDSAITRIANE